MITSQLSKKSFSNRAAWFSFITPLVTFGLTLVVAKVALNSNTMDEYLLGAFCVQVVSLILGVVSLFGIPKHGARLIAWKAVIGILASCGMGILIFLFAIGNALGRNC